MKSIEEIARRRPEFADRRPDLPPLPPAPLREPGRVPRGAVIGAAAVLLIAQILAMPWLARRSDVLHAREWLEVLRLSLQAYETENGVLPPGDGTGSVELVKALRTPFRGGGPFFHFPPEGVDDDGHLVISGHRVLYRAPLLTEDAAYELRVWAGGEWVVDP